LTKEEYLSEAAEEASEPQKKKVKKAKVSSQIEATGSDVPSIQEEVHDLDPIKVLNNKTRSGKSTETSQSLLAQPSFPKKKRKHVVRKLKISSHDMEEEEEVEDASELVSRELKKKKGSDAAALKKALEIAKETEVSAKILLKESTVEAAQLGIELTDNLQQLVVSGELVDTIEGVQKEAGCSEANASKVEKGNTDSLHTTNIIDIESSTTLDSQSTSASP